MPAPFWIKDLGRRGEYLARRHYHRRGYHKVETNWRHHHGEVDLIMAHWRKLVFVEVKARRLKPNQTVVGEVITAKQTKRLLFLAGTFLQQWPQDQIDWTFQLMLIIFPSTGGYYVETNSLNL